MQKKNSVLETCQIHYKRHIKTFCAPCLVRTANTKVYLLMVCPTVAESTQDSLLIFLIQDLRKTISPNCQLKSSQQTKQRKLQPRVNTCATGGNSIAEETTCHCDSTKYKLQRIYMLQQTATYSSSAASSTLPLSWTAPPQEHP
jgi:hypothetical protein